MLGMEGKNLDVFTSVCKIITLVNQILFKSNKHICKISVLHKLPCITYLLSPLTSHMPCAVYNLRQRVLIQFLPSPPSFMTPSDKAWTNGLQTHPQNKPMNADWYPEGRGLRLGQGCYFMSFRCLPVLIKKKEKEKKRADWVTGGFVYILGWFVANLYMPTFPGASECLLQHD